MKKVGLTCLLGLESLPDFRVPAENEGWSVVKDTDFPEKKDGHVVWSLEATMSFSWLACAYEGWRVFIWESRWCDCEFVCEFVCVSSGDISQFYSTIHVNIFLKNLFITVHFLCIINSFFPHHRCFQRFV